MLEQWMINALIFCGILTFTNGCSLIIGYAMGRNSAERPVVSEAQHLPFDQGPSVEPEEDLFREAMQGPDDKRVATIKQE